MTVEFSIESDLKKFTKDFKGLQKKKIPQATANALNKTARGVVKALSSKTDKVFKDGAVAWTKRGFQHGTGFGNKGKATPKDLATIVKVKPQQNQYLKYQIEGGTRTPKGRAILGANQNTVRTNLTKQGNLKRNTIQKLINDNEKYFKGTPKGSNGSEGIWERYGKTKAKPSGQRIRQIARYLKSGQYRPKFPFYQTGEQVFFGRNRGAFFRTFQKEMTKILAKAGYR